MGIQLIRPNVFKSDTFDFDFIRAIGYAPYGAASIGECYYVADQIKKHKETYDIWVSEWEKMAQRIEQLANNFDTQGNQFAAGPTYMRAWNYYRAAEFFTMPQGSERQKALYVDSLRCFDNGAKFAPFEIEKIDIPYESTTLPGYFFKAKNVNEPRPTIILNGGGDGAGEELLYLCGGPQAIDYGFNLITFHGPGHRGALHQDSKLFFRYDWENVIGPVINYCESRSDVNLDAIGLYGVSLGGFLGPRAVAAEPRIKAIAVNSILPYYFQHWTDTIVAAAPKLVRKYLTKKFEEFTLKDWENLFSKAGSVPDFEFVRQLMCWTNGTSSFGEMLLKVKDIENYSLANKITIPFLSIQSEGEGDLMIAHAKQFFDSLTCPKEHIFLTANMGADSHCALNNVPYASDLVYSWFQKNLK